MLSQLQGGYGLAGAVAVFVAGLFFAPTLIVAMALVEQIVPPAPAGWWTPSARAAGSGWRLWRGRWCSAPRSQAIAI
ncbi:UNVERIFIED_ORG: hypothetical protein J2Y84_004144 [Pseudomonas reinekei]|nr:hypothetical protein [Pseudomonas reinekei]MDF9902504.1 hypothetical protein [Pseudomonas reinekei]